MTITFVAAINSLSINAFTINGFGITAFRTFAVAPAITTGLAAVAEIDASDDDDCCCTGVMVPPEKAPLRTPWGSTRWPR